MCAWARSRELPVKRLQAACGQIYRRYWRRAGMERVRADPRQNQLHIVVGSQPFHCTTCFCRYDELIGREHMVLADRLEDELLD